MPKLTDEEKIEQAREAVNGAQTKLDRLTGEQDAELRRLREDYDIKDLKQAKRKLTKLKEERQIMEAGKKKKIEKLEEHFDFE